MEINTLTIGCQDEVHQPQRLPVSNTNMTSYRATELAGLPFVEVELAELLLVNFAKVCVDHSQ